MAYYHHHLPFFSFLSTSTTMDSDDLGYNERMPHEGASNRPFQLQFPLGQSLATPRTGRTHQQGPRQSHPTVFARSSQTPKHQPRLSMSGLQSPARGEFMNGELDFGVQFLLLITSSLKTRRTRRRTSKCSRSSRIPTIPRRRHGSHPD